MFLASRVKLNIFLTTYQYCERTLCTHVCSYFSEFNIKHTRVFPWDGTWSLCVLYILCVLQQHNQRQNVWLVETIFNHQEYYRSKVKQVKSFRPSLSYHLSLRSLFCLFLSDRFTQVLCCIWVSLLPVSISFSTCSSTWWQRSMSLWYVFCFISAHIHLWVEAHAQNILVHRLKIYMRFIIL